MHFSLKCPRWRLQRLPDSLSLFFRFFVFQLLRRYPSPKASNAFQNAAPSDLAHWCHWICVHVIQPWGVFTRSKCQTTEVKRYPTHVQFSICMVPAVNALRGIHLDGRISQLKWYRGGCLGERAWRPGSCYSHHNHNAKLVSRGRTFTISANASWLIVLNAMQFFGSVHQLVWYCWHEEWTFITPHLSTECSLLQKPAIL